SITARTLLTTLKYLSVTQYIIPSTSMSLSISAIYYTTVLAESVTALKTVIGSIGSTVYSVMSNLLYITITILAPIHYSTILYIIHQIKPYILIQRYNVSAISLSNVLLVIIQQSSDYLTLKF